MALQTIPGRGLYLPDPFLTLGAPSFSTATLDATSKKVAFCGRVWFPGRTGTKDVTRVGFRFGTVTKTGGSGLTVSLQDVLLSTGPPIQPDETQDQTVAIANGDASFASNTWIRTGALSANRTITYGDLLSVVIEFDGSGRLGSDSVNISTPGLPIYNYSQGVMLLKNVSWASQNILANVVLEFTDGTWGTLEGGLPVSGINTHTINSGTGTADEYAMEFSLPFPFKVDELFATIAPAGGSSDFELLLYDGTTAMATVAVDGNTLVSAGRTLFVPIPETTCTANTVYRVAVRPTTTNNVTVYSLDVADANHFTCHGFGTPGRYTTRLDQGSWAAATTTRRLMAGVRLSALDDGVSGGGGSTGPIWIEG
jgi:hypothetical protein